jgi:hypothetical protein
MEEQSMPAQTVTPKRDRPDIPKEYGIATGKKGMLEWEWVVNELEKSKSYWLISLYPDGRPHCVPSWGAWVDNRLYFSGGDMTRHAKNLAANPNMIMHLESGDNAVIVHGIAEKAENVPPETMKKVEAAYVAKYGMGEGATYSLVPHKVLAWTSGEGGDFGSSPTRFLFEK